MNKEANSAVRKGLHNIVAEAILISISLTWLLLFMQFTNQVPLPNNVNYVGLELFACYNGEYYIRVIKPGTIHSIAENTSLFIYNQTTSSFSEIILPFYAKKDNILLVKADNNASPWLRSGDLIYFLVDKIECKAILLDAN